MITHHYTIYAADVRGAEAAVLFSAYRYILTGFKPGQKMTKVCGVIRFLTAKVNICTLRAEGFREDIRNLFCPPGGTGQETDLTANTAACR